MSAELSIAYYEAAAVSDSDSDGLTDAQEDTDPNATVDAGETDAHDDDSDDDGYTDGSEVLVHGTDPTDADNTALGFVRRSMAWMSATVCVTWAVRHWFQASGSASGVRPVSFRYKARVAASRG